MAQFISFDQQAEVSGNLICSLMKSSSEQEKNIENILSKYNLAQPEAQAWYPLQDYLNVLAEISRNFGPHWLFKIGKQFTQGSFASEDDLELALRELDELYHSNHRGESGYYKLLTYNKEKREAVIECKNPYPCYLDRGVLSSIAQRFKPVDARFIYVELERNRPSRLAGADVSFYNILWM
jgi:hypothetical protein